MKNFGFSSKHPVVSTGKDKISHELKLNKDMKFGKYKVGNFIEETGKFQYYKLITTNTKYLVKIAKDKKDLANELKILKKILKFPNLPTLPKKYTEYDKDLKLAYLIRERFTNNLYDVSKESSFTGDDLLEVALSIFDGIEWLHKNGVLFVNFNPKYFSYNDTYDIKFTNFEYAETCTKEDKDDPEERCKGNLREPNDHYKFEREYSAVNVQQGAVVVPESDIESFIYLLYSINNKCVLPWSGETNKTTIKMKEGYIPESQSLYKIILYLKELPQNTKLDYKIIRKQLEKINSKIVPKIENIFIQKTSESDAQFQFRMILYKMIQNLDPKFIEYDSDYDLSLDSEGSLKDKDNFAMTDTLSMKATELLLNRLWYNVKYSVDIEKMLDVLQNSCSDLWG